MLRLGLGALAHANWHAAYYSHENDQWNELSVLQAAHAAEILIKARIAEEHPLLIFEQLPKAREEGQKISFLRLLGDGRTILYRDLPDRLWATTGIHLADLENFKEFGFLRNMVQHFAAPTEIDLSQRTLEFIFGVIDPFINQCWDEFAIDFNEDHEPYEYFAPVLLAREIEFLVSPECAYDFRHMRIEWPKNGVYRNTMERRFADALAVHNELYDTSGSFPVKRDTA